MGYKARKNKLFKWFGCIGLVAVAVYSLIATAFAAPDAGATCSICGKGYGILYAVGGKEGTYQEAYSVPDIPGLSDEEYGGHYFDQNSDGFYVFTVKYNGQDICLSCLEAKIAEYKASVALNATVPASLPIHVGTDGKVTTATNASITNNGLREIEISSINITTNIEWTVQNRANAANSKIGSKVIAIGFDDSWATPNEDNTVGTVKTIGFDRIAPTDTLKLAYDAIIPAASEAENADEVAATATFVVAIPVNPVLEAGSDWYKSSQDRSSITKITFMDTYQPTGSENESWIADANGTGTITCYRTGSEIIIAGNGTGEIKANTNSNHMFSSLPSSGKFTNLKSIENLNLLETSNVTNMSYMFLGCSNLSGLDLSNLNTSKVANMAGMFSYCSSLTNLDVSGFDTSRTTDMHSMFDTCGNLTSLSLANFDTSNVINMASMFHDCRSLSTLNVSSFNTSKTTDMSSMFYRCFAIDELNISNFNTTNVTNMSYMFNECGVRRLDIGNFKTSNTTDMRYMFAYCGGLKAIYASSGWNTDKVTDSSDMFVDCYSLKGDISYDSNYVDKTYAKTTEGYLLKAVPIMTSSSNWYKSTQSRDTITRIVFMDSYVPSENVDEQWNADVYSLGDIKCYRMGTEIIIAGNGSGNIKANENSSEMFYNWRSSFSALTSIENLTLLDTSNVSRMDNMFRSCRGLTSLDISNFDTSEVTTMSNMFYGCSGLTYLDVSKFNTSQVRNMYYMFGTCSGLTHLDVSNFDTSHVTDMAYMFAFCEQLQNIDVSKFKTSNVQSMSHMFNECKKLASLNVSNFDTSRVTTMSNMFYDCRALTNLDVSNFDTSRVTTMSNMFYNCRVLTSLDVSHFDTSKSSDTSGMFYNCCGLTSLDVSNFDTSRVTTMFNMFWNCSELTTLDVSNFETSKVTTMSDMFGCCEELTSLDLSNFNTSCVTKMYGMFQSCSGLTALNLSNFNTSRVTNMGCMFMGCKGLTTLDVSNFDTSQVTTMYLMFADCKGLTILDLSNFDTSNVSIMSAMFENSSGLTSLGLSNFNTSNVTQMEEMFYGCSDLRTIYAGDNWNTDKVTSSNEMFAGCTVLKGDISYNGSYIDKTYAKTSGGYLTYKAATRSLKLNIDSSGVVNGYTENSAA